MAALVALNEFGTIKAPALYDQQTNLIVLCPHFYCTYADRSPPRKRARAAHHRRAVHADLTQPGERPLQYGVIRIGRVSNVNRVRELRDPTIFSRPAAAYGSTTRFLK